MNIQFSPFYAVNNGMNTWDLTKTDSAVQFKFFDKMLDGLATSFARMDNYYSKSGRYIKTPDLDFLASVALNKRMFGCTTGGFGGGFGNRI